MLPAILVVDMDPVTLESITKVLEEDFCVYATSSPFYALDMIKRGTRFSAILYDYNIPSMYGDVFFRRVRNITVATRILLAPEEKTDFLIAALNEGGISFFLPKPLDRFTVKDIVHRAVARSDYRRQLRHEQLLLKGLLDHLPYGLAFKDEQGKFTRMNELAAARRGLVVEDCLGKTEEEVEPSFNKEELGRFYQRLQNEERFIEMLEVPNKNIHEQSQWFVITRLLLGRAKGEIARPSVLMELDITEQKQMEAKLQQSEKLQALGTMAGGIAHDFNNLLTTIIGSLEMSEQLLESIHGNTDQESNIQYLLSNALVAAEKGATLTERLLSFSRRKKLVLQHIDIRKKIKQNYELLKQTLYMRYAVRNKDDVKLTFNDKFSFVLEDRLLQSLFVKTDPSQLELAVMNLCINSVDAMPDGGEIKIILDIKNIPFEVDGDGSLSPGQYAEICIKDNGSGMSPETVKRVFEPFFTTKGGGLGTGLGLAMVYGFAQQSGGDVVVDSQVNKGTAISIYLPVDLHC